MKQAVDFEKVDCQEIQEFYWRKEDFPRNYAKLFLATVNILDTKCNKPILNI